jgi:predicted N-acetyltransferase YhbS
VAERNGEIIGSNFMDERSQIGSIGPISVAPASQNSGVGRRLMEHTVHRAMKSKAGVRLGQLAYHNRSDSRPDSRCPSCRVTP